MATNLRKTDIPEEYLRVLDAAGVEIREIPFDSFRFRGDYLWALAFYKLCALKHFCSRDDWDCFCYMDSDVYCQANFDPIWKECERNILLYDINHGLQAEHYRRFCEEVREFGKNNELITHFGGEFFAASNKLGKEFCRRAEEIYREMIARDFVTTKGDEFILSLAAHSMRAHVKNAGAYIFRFWSGFFFRLVSTCFQANGVLALHLPAEKKQGILRIYDSFIKKGKIPKNKTVWKICRLTRVPFVDRIKKLLYPFAVKILRRRK